MFTSADRDVLKNILLEYNGSTYYDPSSRRQESLLHLLGTTYFERSHGADQVTRLLQDMQAAGKIRLSDDALAFKHFDLLFVLHMEAKQTGEWLRWQLEYAQQQVAAHIASKPATANAVGPTVPPASGSVKWKFVVCQGEGLDLHLVYQTSTHYILGADMTGGTYQRGECHQFGKLAPLFSVSLDPELQTVSLKRYELARPWPNDSEERAEELLAKINFADRCAGLVRAEVVEREITPADACAWRTEHLIPETYNDRIEVWDRRTCDDRETVFMGTPSRDLSFPFAPDGPGNSLEDMLHASKQAWAAAGFPLPTDRTEFDNM